VIFLLDTNAFTDLMREHPLIIAHLVNLPADDREVICSVIVERLSESSDNRFPPSSSLLAPRSNVR
jgi:hypothetical protein